MSLTNHFVKTTVEEFNIKSPKVFGLIENNRVRIIDVTSNRRELFNDHYDIDNWVV